jgi:hypothetical protein
LLPRRDELNPKHDPKREPKGEEGQLDEKISGAADSALEAEK